MTPSTSGVPSGFILSHIISGSMPARRCIPVRDSKSSWMRFRLPRQSEVRNEPPSSSSSRPRKHVHHTRATFGSHGQGHERLGLGDADQLPRLGPVADVLAVAVDEEVRRRAVHELEALLGHRLPVRRGHALPHDPAGDGDELVVDVGDPRRVDSPAHLGHALRAPVCVDELLEIGRHSNTLLVGLAGMPRFGPGKGYVGRGARTSGWSGHSQSRRARAPAHRINPQFRAIATPAAAARTRAVESASAGASRRVGTP